MTRDQAQLLWYFAYGSNLDPEIFEGRRRMRPVETLRARLSGYRLVFNLAVAFWQGVANLEPDPDGAVYGVAYRIPPFAAKLLDVWEGVPVGFYRRAPVEVSTDQGKQIQAFTYVSRHGKAGRKPSARYMGIILRGARYHRLPESYIEFLEGVELAFDVRRRRR